MSIFASINGCIVPEEQARISVLDNGLTFGDGVYETLRTYHRVPFYLDRHLERLRASAARLGIDLTVDQAELTRRTLALIEHAGHDESFIRIIVTRGVGDISYHFERVQGPTVIMVVRRLELYPERHYAEGAPIAVVSVRRNHPLALDPAIKSCNLLNNILAVREAQGVGAVEGLMLNERGEVAEGASSNVFTVRGGVLRTPPVSAGILAGITRALVLEQAPALALDAREEPLTVEALVGADEAFITSSVREVMPARTINGRPLTLPCPGPVTARVLAAYRAHAEQVSRRG